MTDSKSVSAELVTSGTEILLGDIVDTNAAWIAQQLREIGVNLYYKTTVGDNEPRLRGVLELALGRSDVVLVTGGLGPTADDITRDAIANATGCPLERHPDIEENLRVRFARWGYQRMSENNLRQAQIPEAATVLENPVGTAPGFITFDRRRGRGGRVIAMPGVPREMKRMMTDLVLPFLQDLTGGVGVIRRRILRTVGIGESSLDAELGDLMDSTNPTMGLAAHLGQADVRIAARASSADEAEGLLDQMEGRVRAVIGSYIYSTTPEETVESVLAGLLQKADATVTLCHSHTRDLPALVRQADVLIAALGQPLFVKAEWLKPGVAIIDVGTNRIEDPSSERGWRWAGDVDFERARQVAGAISRVPGGVGPMTITMLLRHTLLAAQRSLGPRV